MVTGLFQCLCTVVDKSRVIMVINFVVYQKGYIATLSSTAKAKKS
jgi:hypothetical protein